MKKRFENKVVWITGASSGIGEAVAYRMAEEGANLILTSRNETALAAVAKKCSEHSANVKILPADLADIMSLENISEQAWNIFGKIDVVFNNAGISQRSTAVESGINVMEKIMDVNFFAPVRITKTLLPKMIANGGGQIVVTTSIAGKFGFPLRSAYSSSKFALYGFFETIQTENYNDNIRVTFVCPGRVQTNISLYALEKDGTAHGKMDAGQVGGISSEKAAKKIVKAIYRKKRETFVGGKELIMVYIKRFFPALAAKIARNIKPM